MKKLVIEVQEWEAKVLVSDTDNPYTTTIKLGIFPTDRDGKNYAFALSELLDNADYAKWDSEIYYFGGESDLYEGIELDKGTFIVGNVRYNDTHYFYVSPFKHEENVA